jgi:hypothetical protein
MAGRFEKDINNKIFVALAVIDGIASATRRPKQDAVAMTFSGVSDGSRQPAQPTIATKLKWGRLFSRLWLSRELRHQPIGPKIQLCLIQYRVSSGRPPNNVAA